MSPEQWPAGTSSHAPAGGRHGAARAVGQPHHARRDAGVSAEAVKPSAIEPAGAAREGLKVPRACGPRRHPRTATGRAVSGPGPGRRFDPSSAVAGELALDLHDPARRPLLLVDVGILLDLYADFTQPAEPGIGLDLWDFVAVLGGELLGEIDEVTTNRTQGIARRPRRARSRAPPGTGFPGLARWLCRRPPPGAGSPRGAARSRCRRDPDLLLHGPALLAGRIRTSTSSALSITQSRSGRLAGLDRDPGCVPAARRHLAFHFE